MMNWPDMNRVSMWLALGEGGALLWADFGGYYAPCFFWRVRLRGEDVVDCTYRPTLCLPR